MGTRRGHAAHRGLVGPRRSTRAERRRARALVGIQLVLYVSNQSLVDEPVRIVIMIDGARVAGRSVHGGGSTPLGDPRLDLAPGRHVITMASDTGTSAARRRLRWRSMVRDVAT